MAATAPTTGHPEDSVQRPPVSTYESPETRYTVTFQKLGHVTGHPSRLDRRLGASVPALRSADHSQKELVAEFLSAFLCHQAGISATLPKFAS